MSNKCDYIPTGINPLSKWIKICLLLNDEPFQYKYFSFITFAFFMLIEKLGAYASLFYENLNNLI